MFVCFEAVLNWGEGHGHKDIYIAVGCDISADTFSNGLTRKACTSLNIHMCVFLVSLLSGVAKFSLKVTVVCSYAYFSLDSKLCVVECACTLCRCGLCSISMLGQCIMLWLVLGVWVVAGEAVGLLTGVLWAHPILYMILWPDLLVREIWGQIFLL